MRKICDIYSFWLENPDLRRQLLRVTGEQNRKNLKNIAKKGVKRIQRAWRHLQTIGQEGEFLSELTPDVVKSIGNYVDPRNKGFRDVRVSLGLEYTPPNPVKVPELVKQTCYELNASDYHPVEAAAAAHLRLTSIQPFEDGNKRTARLIQDRILTGYDLPPAVIPAGEREVYIDLLEQGLVGMRRNELKEQRPFFDYVGGKVNSALDDIIGDLKSNGRNH